MLLLFFTVAIKCPSLVRPNRGSISFSDSLNAGSRATYSCIRGYVLRGNSVRSCLPIGRWTGGDPICFRKRLYIHSN